MILVRFCLYLYWVQRLWRIKIFEWWVTSSFCLWRSTDEAFWEFPAGPKMDSLWSQLYQPQLDAMESLLQPIPISVWHVFLSRRTTGQPRPSPSDSCQIKHQLFFDDSSDGDGPEFCQRSAPFSLPQENPSQPVAGGLGLGCSSLLAGAAINNICLTVAVKGVGVILLPCLASREVVHGANCDAHSGAENPAKMKEVWA